MAVLAPTIALVHLMILTAASAQGLTVDLIRRDSPKSPFYRPSQTSYGRLRDALLRSITRANRMVRPGVHTVVSSGGSGEYVMDVLIGTPPVKIRALVDTGSNLVWVQCKPSSKPCKHCSHHHQNAPVPVFDPAESSTYVTVPCESKTCSTDREFTSCASGVCQYSVIYAGGSQSSGVMSTDQITLGTSAGAALSLPKAVFGCEFNYSGPVFPANDSGIIGLGRTQLSLVDQLMMSHIGGKFSYCLIPIHDTKHASKMYFGDEAKVSGPGAVSTPMLPGVPYYSVTLESFSVGNNKTKVPFASGGANSSVSKGNIILDSGSTLTWLPTEVYQKLETTVSEHIQGRKVKDPQGTLQLCYSCTSDQDFIAPVITAHFTDADVVLNPMNTFLRTSNDVTCFAFGATNHFAIFGNLAQMNFLVGYDLIGETISFKPADCSKL